MAITAEQKKNALAASNPAEFARAIDRDPKRVRAKLRSMGIRVSQDRAAFDKTAKQNLLNFYDGKEEAETKQTKASKKKAS